MKFFFMFQEKGTCSTKVNRCVEWYKGQPRLIYACVCVWRFSIKQNGIFWHYWWRVQMCVHIWFSDEDIVIGFESQWAETKVVSDKSIYGFPFVDPFTHHDANAQRKVAQRKNYDEFHFENDFTVVIRHWLRSGDMSKVKDLADHKKKRTNLFFLLLFIQYL